MQNLRAEGGSVVAGLDGGTLDPENEKRVADVRRSSDEALNAALGGLERLGGPGAARDAAVVAGDIQRLASARRRAAAAMSLDPARRDLEAATWAQANRVVVESVADLSERLSFDAGRDDAFVSRMSMLTRHAWRARATAGTGWMVLHDVMRQDRPPTTEQIARLAEIQGETAAAWGFVRESALRGDAPAEVRAAVRRADQLYFAVTTGRLKDLMSDLAAGRPVVFSGPAWLNAARDGLGALMEAPNAAFALAAEHAHDAATAAQGRFYLVIFLTIGVIGLAWAGARAIRKAFVIPMAEITDATHDVAAGRLDREIPFQDRGDEIGALARALGVFRENARAKARMQGALRRAEIEKQAAEAASRLKSQFLANMSHEIRTPLNGVLGMVQAMEQEDATPSQRQRLSIIRDSGETLLQVLNDVLDFSKIEAGKLELHPEAFDLGEVVRRACAIFADTAAAKGLELRCRIAPEAEGVWQGDPARVRQMLMNLLSNAVKFTSQGAVSVQVANLDGGLAIAVRDTGPGIEPDHLPRLFGKFSQADESVTRQFGGTGLGLAICRELAAMMGGEVGVSSTIGRGSTFTIRLPLQRLADQAPAARPKAAPEPAAETRTGPARILAAEDNAINQKVLGALLTPLGVDLTMVSSGLEAVEAWRTGDWDLILMDIQMPGMSGVDATRQIRTLEASERRRRTPIVAVSANAMQHQMDEYLAAGMELHVSKPIQTAALYAAIETALSLVEADQPQALAG